MPHQDVEMKSDSDIFRDCSMGDFDDEPAAQEEDDWNMDWVILSDEEVQLSEVQVDPEMAFFSD